MHIKYCQSIDDLMLRKEVESFQGSNIFDEIVEHVNFSRLNCNLLVQFYVRELTNISRMTLSISVTATMFRIILTMTFLLFCCYI